MKKLTSKLVGLKTGSKVRGEGENDALTVLWIFLIGVTHLSFATWAERKDCFLMLPRTIWLFGREDNECQ